MTPTKAFRAARPSAPPPTVVQFSFSVEAEDEASHIVVSLFNTGTVPIYVTGLVVSGPTSEGDNATVMTAGTPFAPVPPFAGVVGPKGRCSFFAPPALMAAFRGGLPANWWVQARYGNLLVGEVSVAPLLAAINLCFR